VNATGSDSYVEKNGSDKEIIINTQYFFPDGSNGGIMPYGVVYPEGTIRIDDVIGGTSGRYTADTESAVLNTLLSKSLDLIEGIPIIGTIYATGKEVLDWTLALNSDIFNLDYTKQATLTTYYSFRNFTHKIHAYTNLATWKDVGYSISRYYYKHTHAIVFDKTKGDFVQKHADYILADGFSPAYIAKAPNYMNHATLSSYGNECYWTARYYSENYY